MEETNLSRNSGLKKILWSLLFIIVSVTIGYFLNYTNYATYLLFFGGYFPWIGLAVIAIVETLIFEFIFKKIFADKAKFLLWIMFLSTIFGSLILPGIINRIQVWGTQTKESGKLNQQQNYDFTKKTLIYSGNTIVSNLKIDGDKIIWASNIRKQNDVFGISQLNLFKFNGGANTGSLSKIADLGKDFGYNAQIVGDLVYWVEKTNLNQGKMLSYDTQTKQTKQIADKISGIVATSNDYLMLTDDSINQEKILWNTKTNEKTKPDFLKNPNILGGNFVYFQEDFNKESTFVTQKSDIKGSYDGLAQTDKGFYVYRQSDPASYIKRYNLTNKNTETILPISQVSTSFIAANNDYLVYNLVDHNQKKNELVVRDLKNNKNIISKPETYNSVNTPHFIGKIVNNKLFYESDYSGKINILNFADGKQSNIEIATTGTSQWDSDGKYIVYSDRSNNEAEIFIEPISN
jgi:hypothetical protein